MKKYLESRGLGGNLADLFKPGEQVDLLANATRIIAWADKEGSIGPRARAAISRSAAARPARSASPLSWPGRKA